jgi:hypothetical protein
MSGCLNYYLYHCSGPPSRSWLESGGHFWLSFEIIMSHHHDHSIVNLKRLTLSKMMIRFDTRYHIAHRYLILFDILDIARWYLISLDDTLYHLSILDIKWWYSISHSSSIFDIVWRYLISLDDIWYRFMILDIAWWYLISLDDTLYHLLILNIACWN